MTQDFRRCRVVTASVDRRLKVRRGIRSFVDHTPTKGSPAPFPIEGRPPQMPTPRTSRLALAGAAALAVAALLASCAGQPATTDAAAAGEPVAGGSLTYLEHQAH